MGGYDSGRQGGRPTVEGCWSLVLDINRVMRPVADARRKGAEGALAVTQRIRWTSHGETEPWAEVDIAILAHQEHAVAVLRFDVAHVSHRTGPQAQRAEIDSTPCNFGGARWHWVCPRTGWRAQKLYLPNGGTRFLSQRAYGLAWRSQRASALDRSHARLARIARRLDWEYDGFSEAPPPKSKWMRWGTYRRLAAEWQAAAARHDAIWLGGATRLLARARRLRADFPERP
jgi:hypothetical protein